VVEPPLWKIWVRQLGWWHEPNMMGNSSNMFQSPPTSYGLTYPLKKHLAVPLGLGPWMMGFTKLAAKCAVWEHIQYQIWSQQIAGIHGKSIGFLIGSKFESNALFLDTIIVLSHHLVHRRRIIYNHNPTWELIKYRRWGYRKPRDMVWCTVSKDFDCIGKYTQSWEMILYMVMYGSMMYGIYNIHVCIYHVEIYNYWNDCIFVW